MAGPAVKFDVQDGIAIVTMNKPDVLNAMDQEVMDGLNAAWREIRDNPDIIVGIITGAWQSQNLYSSGD